MFVKIGEKASLNDVQRARIAALFKTNIFERLISENLHVCRLHFSERPRATSARDNNSMSRIHVHIDARNRQTTDVTDVCSVE